MQNQTILSVEGPKQFFLKIKADKDVSCYNLRFIEIRSPGKIYSHSTLK